HRSVFISGCIITILRGTRLVIHIPAVWHVFPDSVLVQHAVFVVLIEIGVGVRPLVAVHITPANLRISYFYPARFRRLVGQPPFEFQGRRTAAAALPGLGAGDGDGAGQSVGEAGAFQRAVAISVIRLSSFAAVGLLVAAWHVLRYLVGV